MDAFSGFKHVEADIVGSSSGSGIFNWGNKITLTKLLLFVRSTCGAKCCVPVHACLLVAHLFDHVTLQTD